jgi:hypothetical protein
MGSQQRYSMRDATSSRLHSASFKVNLERYLAVIQVSHGKVEGLKKLKRQRGMSKLLFSVLTITRFIDHSFGE